MTIYRRWPNKAAIIMDAFVTRVDPGTLFSPASSFKESIRLQMRTMAKAFRGKDGALIRVLLAEAQFDPELAKALRERWTMPRRRMAIEYFGEGMRQGALRPDIDPDAMIDLLYAPLYYRLQMGTGPLSDAYVDEIFEHGMKGLEPTLIPHRQMSSDPFSCNLIGGLLLNRFGRSYTRIVAIWYSNVSQLEPG